MGRKTGTETAIALIACFIQDKSWNQSALARAVELTVPALRKKLIELQAAGIVLERQEDAPHVWWSVKASWMPGTVKLEADDVRDLLRLLSRLPNGAAKGRVLARILDGYVGAGAMKRNDATVLPPTLGPQEEHWLGFVEDAAGQGQVLRFRYLSARAGVVETREASPHRVVPGPPARFMATCHRSGKLKWFRVDRMSGATLEGKERARKVDEKELEEALRTSVNGYRDAVVPTELRFFVGNPEAQWVIGNLPTPLEASVVEGGIVVRGTTAAVVQIARFVVGLGGAARCETPELRAMVRELAEGAVEAAGGTEHAASRADRTGGGVTKH